MSKTKDKAKEIVAEDQVMNTLLKTNLDLKKKVLFYERIFSEVNASIVIFDLVRLKAIWTNETLRKTLGLNRSRRLSAEEILDLYHPEDQNMLLEMQSFFKENRHGIFTAFYKFRNAKGEYIWFYTAAKVFKLDPAEGVFEVLGVSLNLSDQLTYGKNLKLFTQDKLKKINHKNVERITTREKQIVKYFSNGFKSREIAELLGLSFHTVNNHRKNILKKLELKNLAALVNFAVENGLD
jgi:LuxR family transcriptional regulator, quorum-sensing system regulator SdiA